MLLLFHGFYCFYADLWLQKKLFNFAFYYQSLSFLYYSNCQGQITFTQMSPGHFVSEVRLHYRLLLYFYNYLGNMKRMSPIICLLLAKQAPQWYCIQLSQVYHFVQSNSIRILWLSIIDIAIQSSVFCMVKNKWNSIDDIFRMIGPVLIEAYRGGTVRED